MSEYQLDMFGPAPLISRWSGDGPFHSEVWRDEGNGTAIRRFFDGTGWCQMLAASCRRCGVWHPLDRAWGENRIVAAAYRCTGGAGWASHMGIADEAAA